MIYRLKTDQGYYFTQSNGRYGRFYGQQNQYEPLCKEHAEVVAETWRRVFGDIDERLVIKVEETRSNIPCAICKREGKR